MFCRDGKRNTDCCHNITDSNSLRKQRDVLSQIARLKLANRGTFEKISIGCIFVYCYPLPAVKNAPMCRVKKNYNQMEKIDSSEWFQLMIHILRASFTEDHVHTNENGAALGGKKNNLSYINSNNILYHISKVLGSRDCLNPVYFSCNKLHRLHINGLKPNQKEVNFKKAFSFGVQGKKQQQEQILCLSETMPFQIFKNN